MIVIEKDKNYRCNKFRQGENENGKWELVGIADAKGNNEVTIFPSNAPCGAYEGCEFVIREIHKVKIGRKLNKAEGKWYQQNTIDAEIDVIKSDIPMEDGVFSDVSDLPWDVDSELPL